MTVCVVVTGADTSNLLKVIAGLSAVKNSKIAIYSNNPNVNFVMQHFLKGMKDNINFVESDAALPPGFLLVSNETDRKYIDSNNLINHSHTAYVIKDISDNTLLYSWKYQNMPLAMLIDIYSFYTNKNYQILQFDDTINRYINDFSIPSSLVINPVKITLIEQTVRSTTMINVDDDLFVPLSNEVYIDANTVLRSKNFKLRHVGSLSIISDTTDTIYGQLEERDDINGIHWISSMSGTVPSMIKVKIGNTIQDAAICPHIPSEKKDFGIFSSDGKMFYRHNDIYHYFSILQTHLEK